MLFRSITTDLTTAATTATATTAAATTPDPPEFDHRQVSASEWGNSLSHLHNSSISLSSSNAPWECFLCTFVNDNSLHLTCHACGEERAPRQQQPEEELQPEQQDRQQPQHPFWKGYDLAAFSKSMIRDIQGQTDLFVEQQRQHLETLAVTKTAKTTKTAMTKTTMTTTATTATMDQQQQWNQQTMALIQEQQELEEMQLSLQIQKNAMEAKEGMSMEELVGMIHRPGACKVSPLALDWMAQQRMVTDWKKQLQQRDQELQAVRNSIGS